MDFKPPEDQDPPFQTIYEEKRVKHLKVINISGSYTPDWSIVPDGTSEAGRGLIDGGEKGKDEVLVRYYAFPGYRFEPIRHYAEVILGKNEKFIVDGVDMYELVQQITNIIWDVVASRKIMRKAYCNLRVVK